MAAPRLRRSSGFLLQNADTAEPIGTGNVRISLTLDRAAETLLGTFVSQIKDIADGLADRSDRRLLCYWPISV